MKKLLSISLLAFLSLSPLHAAYIVTSVAFAHDYNYSNFYTKTNSDGSRTLSYVYMQSGSSLSDSYLNDSTITNYGYLFYGDTSSTSYGTTYVTNVDFSGNTYDDSTGDVTDSVIWAGYNNPQKGYEYAVLSNVSFDGGNYTKTQSENAYFLVAYNSTLTDVSFDGTSVSLSTSAPDSSSSMEYFTWLSSAKVYNCDFTNMDITLSGEAEFQSIIGISGNGTDWTQLNNTSFLGTEITIGTAEARGIDETDIVVGTYGSKAEIQNVTWSDGKLYSTGAFTWTTSDGNVYHTDSQGKTYAANTLPDNLGIILDSSDDLLTIDGSVYLDVSCTISEGTIEFDMDGATPTLSLVDGIELTIADTDTLIFEILNWDATKTTIDISELILVEDGSALTIAGAESNEAALACLNEMITFTDAAGNTLDSSLVTITNTSAMDLTGASYVIPEPCTSSLSLLALASLLTYRRKRAA